jgi:anaerobic dimethyl sulfoxide reductase subunit C (anchor subunit)
MGDEWSLVFFTALTALGTGTFAGVGVSEWWGKAEYARAAGAIMALVALAAGGFSSVLHLGHPERIFGALGHPTSGIFLEALMIGLTGVCVIAYLIAVKKNASSQVRKKIALAGVVLAILLAFAVGDTYVMSSRPAWDTLILPLVYLASAFVLGCFSFSLLLGLNESAETTIVIKRTTLVGLGIQGVLIVAYLVALAVAPYPDISRSPARVLAGNLAPLFWIGIVLIGLLIPGALVALRKAEKPSSPAGAVFCLLCVFVGAVTFRLLMFNLGSSIRQFFPA